LKKRPVDVSLINTIEPVGKFGHLKGEEEMITKGLEYVTLLREKFKGRERVFFKELELVKLTKQLKLNYNFVRFINKYEMSVRRRKHSLRFPDGIPSYQYLEKIYREYRKYDTEVQLKSQRSLNEEERRARLDHRNEIRNDDHRNKRRRDTWILNRIKEELEQLKFDEVNKEFERAKFNFDFMEELEKEFPKLEKACKAITYKNDVNSHTFLELFQETVKLAIEYKHRYTIGTNISAWMIRIAMNVNYAFYKKLKVKGKYEVPIYWDRETERQLEIPSWDKLYGEEDNSALIFQCFENLPEHYKQILEMKMKGNSHEEIALKLGFKDQTYSKTKLYNARHVLAKDIKSKTDIIIKSTSGKYH